MARKHQAAKYLLDGLSPSRIADKMGISISSVLGYLFNQVGEGKICRTDIVFSIDSEIRREIEKTIHENRSPNLRAIQRRLNKRGVAVTVDREDLDVYLKLRRARVDLGDLYEALREIELFLHSLIRATMIDHHGAGGWWRQGIPLQIRQECVMQREGDDPPAEDPFCYTTLIQTAKIFEKNWGLLSKKLPPKNRQGKKCLLVPPRQNKCDSQCSNAPLQGPQN